MPTIAAFAFLAGCWFAAGFVMATSSPDEPQQVAEAVGYLGALLLILSAAAAIGFAVATVVDWVRGRCPNG
jgi:hypothetical protein